MPEDFVPTTPLPLPFFFFFFFSSVEELARLPGANGCEDEIEAPGFFSFSFSFLSAARRRPPIAAGAEDK